MDIQKAEVSVTLKGAEEATKKAVELVQKIEEAKTLAGELASLIGQLEIEI